MKIFFIGKFAKLYDEEYIARSLEYIGHEVTRIPLYCSDLDVSNALKKVNPNIILYCKWVPGPLSKETINLLKRTGTKTVCWLFDLYFNYAREHQVRTMEFFKSDYVFTTDGGHQEDFKKAGVNHFCLRQGIYKDDCYMIQGKYENDVIFVGSDNPLYQERTELMEKLAQKFNFKWFGRGNTDEVRNDNLNVLFSKSKIIVGDSVFSPNYWSNRVVETLGRGGFMIHQDVPGIKEEYPYLVTYKKGDFNDLCQKIEFYIKNDDLREEIRKKNFEWVRDNYTADKKCKELINICQNL